MAQSDSHVAQLAAGVDDLRRRIAHLETAAGERRLVVEALRHSEARYRSLVENLPVGVYRTTPGARGEYLVANPAFLTMFGFESEEELKQVSVCDQYYDPAERRRFSDNLLTKGQVSRQELHLRKRDGTPLWGAVTSRLAHDPMSGFTYFDNVIEDITERKQSERLEKALYGISQAATSTGDLQSLFAEVHQTVSQLIPARNLFIALYDESADLVTFPYYVDEYDVAPSEGTPVRSGRGITEYLLRKGVPVLLSEEEANQLTQRGEIELVGSPCRYWLGVPLKTAVGKTIGVLVVQTYSDDDRYEEKDKDLLVFVSTQIAMAIERKKAEDALRSSEEHFRSIFDNAGAGISLHSVDSGRFLDANRALQNMLGYGVEELKNLTWADLCHPEDRSSGHDMATDAARCPAEAIQYEKRFLRQDGTTMWARMALSLLLDAERRPQCALAVTQDISDRVQAEHEKDDLQVQFLQAQKMEAIGRLTAGIAHDFNNMLTVINGYAERVRGQLPEEDPLYEQVDRIHHAGWRAADLVRQLLVFSRKHTGEPQVVSLNAAVTELDLMLRRVIGEDVVLKTVLASDLWSTEVDPSHIEQVLINLAVNARDAMPKGGSLLIETANVTLDQTYVHCHPQVRPGEYVRLTVSDTGIGMSDQVKAHLFEPFFTTKPLGKGTGLGLPTTYGIVQRCGGHIQVESEEGSGCTFRIHLPRAARAARPGVQPGTWSEEDTPGGDETILLVEDDESMGDLACNVLRGRGYAVTLARDGQRAIDVADSAAGPIHLLLTDVVLPDVSGVIVSERVRAIRPDVKVLFMSGYAEDTMERHGLQSLGSLLLRKPFGPADLCHKVRSVLDSQE